MRLDTATSTVVRICERIDHCTHRIYRKWIGFGCAALRIQYRSYVHCLYCFLPMTVRTYYIEKRHEFHPMFRGPSRSRTRPLLLPKRGSVICFGKIWWTCHQSCECPIRTVMRDWSLNSPFLRVTFPALGRVAVYLERSWSWQWLLPQNIRTRFPDTHVRACGLGTIDLFTWEHWRTIVNKQVTSHSFRKIDRNP